MHNIKLEHTDHMVYHLWNGTDEYMQDKMNRQLHHNIQHPLWVQMRDQMYAQMRDQMQSHVRDYMDENY